MNKETPERYKSEELAELLRGEKDKLHRLKLELAYEIGRSEGKKEVINILGKETRDEH